MSDGLNNETWKLALIYSLTVKLQMHEWHQVTPLEMYTNNEISAQLQRQSSMAIGIVGNESGESLGLLAKQMLI